MQKGYMRKQALAGAAHGNDWQRRWVSSDESGREEKGLAGTYDVERRARHVQDYNK